MRMHYFVLALVSLVATGCGAQDKEKATATPASNTKAARPAPAKAAATAPAVTKTAAAPSTAAGTKAAAPAASTPATTKSAAATAPKTAASKTPPAAPQPAGPNLQREVFTYSGTARRDPFVSLMTSNDLRPTITDLRLVATVVDPTSRNSVAVLRDLTTKEQYRVKIGSTLGRMRVTGITPKGVTFSIEEFGRNRQELLAYSDSTKKRSP